MNELTNFTKIVRNNAHFLVAPALLGELIVPFAIKDLGSQLNAEEDSEAVSQSNRRPFIIDLTRTRSPQYEEELNQRRSDITHEFLSKRSLPDQLGAYFLNRLLQQMASQSPNNKLEPAQIDLALEGAVNIRRAASLVEPELRSGTVPYQQRINQMAENGARGAGIAFEITNLLRGGKIGSDPSKVGIDPIKNTFKLIGDIANDADKQGALIILHSIIDQDKLQDAKNPAYSLFSTNDSKALIAQMQNNPEIADAFSVYTGFTIDLNSIPELLFIEGNFPISQNSAETRALVAQECAQREAKIKECSQKIDSLIRDNISSLGEVTTGIVDVVRNHIEDIDTESNSEERTDNSEYNQSDEKLSSEAIHARYSPYIAAISGLQKLGPQDPHYQSFLVLAGGVVQTEILSNIFKGDSESLSAALTGNWISVATQIASTFAGFRQANEAAKAEAEYKKAVLNELKKLGDTTIKIGESIHKHLDDQERREGKENAARHTQVMERLDQLEMIISRDIREISWLVGELATEVVPRLDRIEGRIHVIAIRLENLDRDNRLFKIQEQTGVISDAKSLFSNFENPGVNRGIKEGYVKANEIIEFHVFQEHKDKLYRIAVYDSRGPINQPSSSTLLDLSKSGPELSLALYDLLNTDNNNQAYSKHLLGNSGRIFQLITQFNSSEPHVAYQDTEHSYAFDPNEVGYIIDLENDQISNGIYSGRPNLAIWRTATSVYLNTDQAMQNRSLATHPLALRYFKQHDPEGKQLADMIAIGYALKAEIISGLKFDRKGNVASYSLRGALANYQRCLEEVIKTVGRASVSQTNHGTAQTRFQTATERAMLIKESDKNITTSSIEPRLTDIVYERNGERVNLRSLPIHSKDNFRHLIPNEYFLAQDMLGGEFLFYYSDIGDKNGQLGLTIDCVYKGKNETLRVFRIDLKDSDGAYGEGQYYSSEGGKANDKELCLQRWQYNSTIENQAKNIKFEENKLEMSEQKNNLLYIRNELDSIIFREVNVKTPETDPALIDNLKRLDGARMILEFVLDMVKPSEGIKSELPGSREIMQSVDERKFDSEKEKFLAASTNFLDTIENLNFDASHTIENRSILDPEINIIDENLVKLEAFYRQKLLEDNKSNEEIAAALSKVRQQYLKWCNGHFSPANSESINFFNEEYKKLVKIVGIRWAGRVLDGAIEEGKRRYANAESGKASLEICSQEFTKGVQFGIERLTHMVRTFSSHSTYGMTDWDFLKLSDNTIDKMLDDALTEIPDYHNNNGNGNGTQDYWHYAYHWLMHGHNEDNPYLQKMKPEIVRELEAAIFNNSTIVDKLAATDAVFKKYNGQAQQLGELHRLGQGLRERIVNAIDHRILVDTSQIMQDIVLVSRFIGNSPWINNTERSESLELYRDPIEIKIRTVSVEIEDQANRLRGEVENITFTDDIEDTNNKINRLNEIAGTLGIEGDKVITDRLKSQLAELSNQVRKRCKITTGEIKIYQDGIDSPCNTLEINKYDFYEQVISKQGYRGSGATEIIMRRKINGTRLAKFVPELFTGSSIWLLTDEEIKKLGDGEGYRIKNLYNINSKHDFTIHLLRAGYKSKTEYDILVRDLDTYLAMRSRQAELNGEKIGDNLNDPQKIIDER